MKHLTDKEKQEIVDWYLKDFLEHFSIDLIREKQLLEEIPLEDFTAELRERYEELKQLLK